MDEDLDESWILEQERIQTIQTNYCREPMESIRLCFIYINPNQYIDKVIYENHEFGGVDMESSVLSRELILKVVQTKRIGSGGNKKYKLMDTCLYHVDLEPENIQGFSKLDDLSDVGERFFKVLPILDEIRVGPSIFIFHKINTLYFIFEEIDVGDHRHTIKSILKTSGSGSAGSRTGTKKVRIIENLVPTNRPGKARKTIKFR
jgi:hypothetical protein